MAKNAFNSAALQRRPKQSAICTVACALLCGGLVAAWLLRHPAPLPSSELLTLHSTRFRIPHEATGSIEANSAAVVQSGCQWTVRILSLLPEGTWVEKDEVICVLDSSDIQEFLRSREISLIRANAALTASLQQQQLQQAAAERRLSDARFALESAKLELDETLHGNYPAQLQKLNNEINVSATQAETAADDQSFLQQLWMLGLATRAEVATSHLTLTSRGEQLRRQEGQRHLLTQFTIPRSHRVLEYRVEMLELNLARTDLANSLAETRARMIALSDQRRLDIYERYARTARESIEACMLRAPRAGRVIHSNNWYARSRGIRTIEEGRSVYFSQPIFEIPDESQLKVCFPINETLLSRFSVGMPADVTLAGFEDDPVPATITHIASMPRTRWSNGIEVTEYWAEAVLEPASEQRPRLHPRMDATVTLPLADHRDAIVVPRDAVQQTSNGPCVFLQNPNAPHKVIPISIKPGEVHNNQVHVLEGLRPGDRILRSAPSSL